MKNITIQIDFGTDSRSLVDKFIYSMPKWLKWLVIISVFIRYLISLYQLKT
jgi:hypothetical protein